jgi:AraC family transcriptional regulator
MAGMQTVLELDRLAARPSSRRGRPPSVALGEAIERTRQHLELSLDRAVTLGELAQKAGISRHTLEHRFRAEMGTSPIAFHRALRISEARRLLAATRLSITSIAMRVGFSNPAHFSHVFTTTTGRSPRRYRMEAISGNN